jgi:hypothetical protein
MLLACLTMIFTTSCTATVVSDCAWVRGIVVNAEDRITRPTAEQIVAHNRKVAGFCR